MKDRRIYFSLLALQTGSLFISAVNHQWVAVLPTLGFILSTYMWHIYQREADARQAQSRMLWEGQRKLWGSYQELLRYRSTGAAALFMLLSLASCSRHLRQAPRPYLDPLNAVPTTAAVAWPAKPATRPDSPAPAAPKRRLLGLLPPAKATQSNAIKPGITQSNAIPRKCKGCIINYGSGEVNVAGKKAQQAAGTGAAVTVAAKKAQAAKADSGAFIGQASARTQAAAGRDIAQTATTTKKGLLDYALPAVGIVGGAAALYWLVAGGGGALLWGLVRRKKSTDA